MQTTKSLQNHIFCQLSRCTNARSKSPACTSRYTDMKHYHCSISTGSGNNRKITGGILSDPENKGERQQGVNFDTLGSWNNRINMPLAVEKSIKMGRIIPEIPLEQTHHITTVVQQQLCAFYTMELSYTLLMLATPGLYWVGRDRRSD